MGSDSKTQPVGLRRLGVTHWHGRRRRQRDADVVHFPTGSCWSNQADSGASGRRALGTSTSQPISVQLIYIGTDEPDHAEP